MHATQSDISLLAHFGTSELNYHHQPTFPTYDMRTESAQLMHMQNLLMCINTHTLDPHLPLSPNAWKNKKWMTTPPPLTTTNTNPPSPPNVNLQY